MGTAGFEPTIFRFGAEHPTKLDHAPDGQYWIRTNDLPRIRRTLYQTKLIARKPAPGFEPGT